MARPSLESRVSDLESQVEKLSHELRTVNGRKEKNWQRAVEKYAGDSDLQSIFSEAMKLREADRRRGRRTPAWARGKKR